jgi:3-oxoacyl-[acyl-carrier-protein] synthase-3
MSGLTSSTGVAHTRILGLGTHRPARVVTNAEICEQIDSTDEWIRERSGIAERRKAAPDESLVDMAVSASEKALAAAGVDPGQLGLVLLATFSHLMQAPAAAPLVADRLGATNAAGADVNAACAGFCQALAMASDAVRAGSATYVLVIGVERFEGVIDPTDRGTAFIFGDGAGAVVVGASEEPGIGPVVWGADGAQSDAIIQTAPWLDLLHDREAPYPFLSMQGQKVYRWAVFEMAPVGLKALEAAGVGVDELDAFIPHQANLRIVEGLAKRMKLPESVALGRDIVNSGNTSAASIPLAMERLLETGEVRSGDTALLLGFGAGLSYAGQVVTLP